MGTHPSSQEQARGPQQAGRGTRHSPRGRGVWMHLAELPMAQTPGGAERAGGAHPLGCWALSRAVPTHGHMGAGAGPWAWETCHLPCFCSDLTSPARGRPNTCQGG